MMSFLVQLSEPPPWANPSTGKQKGDRESPKTKDAAFAASSAYIPFLKKNDTKQSVTRQSLHKEILKCRQVFPIHRAVDSLCVVINHGVSIVRNPYA